MFPYPKTWIFSSLGDDFFTDSWDSSEKTTWGPTPSCHGVPVIFATSWPGKPP